MLFLVLFSITIEFDHGGIIRGNTHKKNIALVFTADEFGDGKAIIPATLRKTQGQSFFLFHR